MNEPLKRLSLDTEKILYQGFSCGPYSVFFDGYDDVAEPIIVTINWGETPDTTYEARYPSTTSHSLVIMKTLAWIENQLKRAQVELYNWRQAYLIKETS